jgi:hypothetical protein
VQWDRLFEDLEGQLASEWESERAALSAESERLRIARLELRDRLRVLCSTSAPATLILASARRMKVRLRALGADWVAAVSTEVGRSAQTRATSVIPLRAIRGIQLDHGMLLASLDCGDSVEAGLRDRMTLGFLLRDLARRRVSVSVVTVDGIEIHGTIDRAGADHVDLALHDPGVARLASAVHGFEVIPFEAVASIQTFGDQLL